MNNYTAPSKEETKALAAAVLKVFIDKNPGCTAMQIMDVFFPKQYLFSEGDLRAALLDGIANEKFRWGEGLEIYARN